jgi:hypothetical protein
MWDGEAWERGGGPWGFDGNQWQESQSKNEI